MDRVQANSHPGLGQGGRVHPREYLKFGIPNNIITNLGSNFTSAELFDFCEQKCIQLKHASVAHPRANGQVERANKMILEALRK